MGNYIVSGAAVRKCGANVSAAIPEAAWTEWISGAEAIINATMRNGTLTISGNEFIIADIASSLVCINGIAYDMSGYTSRVEAETMMDVQRDSALRGLSLIRDKKVQDFIVK